MSREKPDTTWRKDYWTDRVEPKLEMVTGWARNGLSDAQIALNLGIGESTFAKFKSEREELQDALYLGREDADVCVENAMFKIATGYSFTEVTKERQRVYDEHGDWTGEYKMVVTKKVTKFVKPEFAAQQYWLEHRSPKRWERNPVPGTDFNTINSAIQSLAELLGKPVPERKIGCEEE